MVFFWIDSNEFIEIKNPSFLTEDGKLRTIYKKGLTKKERGWRVISNALATAIPFLFSLFLWAAVTFMAD